MSIFKSTIEDCGWESDLWMLANKLKLNSNKTEILVFSSSYCPRPALNNLVIASETVDCSTSAKNIGVVFNNSLSMLPHVTAVRKIGKFPPYDTGNILIHAFITSRIDFCNSLLYGQPKYILQRLQSVLNSATRLIHICSRCEHVTPLLIQLSIEQRITFKIAVITFKALHGSAPDYITELIKPYSPSRSLQSSNKLLFKRRFNLMAHGGRSFTMATPSVWNTLPLELRSCCSLSSFKDFAF